ncbi:hypothetical protein HDU77_011113 [Chytriomyces hyalinus]|nr:hypothetical protein HDU77_011113 [Chytriomyces hyalinus]
MRAEARSETLIGAAERGMTKGQNGLMMINATGTLVTVFEECDPDGCWMVVRVGDTIIVSAYLSPSEGADTLAKFDSVMDRLQRQNIGRPIIMIGDFNTQHVHVGDHTTVLNSIENGNRKTWIETWLDNGDWHHIDLVQGKWTTRGENGGHCITDLLFANDHGIPRIKNMIVLDKEIAIGSDHHLITFELLGLEGFTKLLFKRINIRALSGKMEEYREALENCKGEVLQTLTNTIDHIETIRLAGERMAWADRIEISNNTWSLVSDWIHSAAKTTLGLVKFRGGAICVDMMDIHLQELMEWRKTAQESLLEDGLDGITCCECAGKLRYINKIIKKAAHQSHKRLYNAVNDLRVYNSSSEAKCLVCQRARSLRTNCELCPEKLNTYAAHFKTTFGSLPKGTDQPSAAVLHSTDPRQPLLPLSKANTTEMIKNKTLHTLIEWVVAAVLAVVVAGPVMVVACQINIASVYVI